jgi:methionyl-tRNA synthetase
MQISARGNQYLQDNAFLASNPDRCGEVVLLAVNLVYALAPLIHPFMPETSASICKQLNAPMRSAPEAFSIDLLPGHTIGKAAYLFSKIDEKKEDEWRKRYGGETTGAAVDAVVAPPAAISTKEAAKRAKAAAAALAALPRTPAVLELEGKIKEQADRVVGLKKDNVGGVELAEAVRELKERKAAMDVLAKSFSSMSV